MARSMSRWALLPLLATAFLLLGAAGGNAAQAGTAAAGTVTIEPPTGAFRFWSDGVGSVVARPTAQAGFEVTWKDAGSFLVGNGRNVGGRGTATYSGTLTASADAFVGLYGWSRNPLVEYFVVDAYTGARPVSGVPTGTVTSDGGVYDVYRAQRVNQPSIDGIRSYLQYWSVRRQQRTAGTITIANHLNGWASRGLFLGTLDYQILAVQGYRGSGSARFTATFGG